MDMAITPIRVSSISAGALLGTAGTAQLVQTINESLSGASFYDSARDTFRDIRNSILDTIIRPLQQAATTVSNVVIALMNPDVIRPLIEIAHFKTIPPCMYEPIVMYAPLRSLLEQGRISGFGFDPEYLPKEDVWGRLLANGVVAGVLDNVDANGDVWLNYEFHSTDPNPSFEELDAVEATRAHIDWILSNTMLDPTDVEEERG
jgi:hypothetical protein